MPKRAFMVSGFSLQVNVIYDDVKLLKNKTEISKEISAHETEEDQSTKGETAQW